jgi:hypothetical protein
MDFGASGETEVMVLFSADAAKRAADVLRYLDVSTDARLILLFILLLNSSPPGLTRWSMRKCRAHDIAARIAGSSPAMTKE